MVILAVAPFVGAWIETRMTTLMILRQRVAPFVGAWIETAVESFFRYLCIGRSLRGSVD